MLLSRDGTSFVYERSSVSLNRLKVEWVYHLLLYFYRSLMAVAKCSTYIRICRATSSESINHYKRVTSAVTSANASREHSREQQSSMTIPFLNVKTAMLQMAAPSGSRNEALFVPEIFRNQIEPPLLFGRRTMHDVVV